MFALEFAVLSLIYFTVPATSEKANDYKPIAQDITR
jgi:hypothetical protein